MNIILFTILTSLILAGLWCVIIGGFSRYTWFNSGLNKHLMFKPGHYRIKKVTWKGSTYNNHQRDVFIIQFKDVFGNWCDYWRRETDELTEMIYHYITYNRSFSTYEVAYNYLNNMKPRMSTYHEEVIDIRLKDEDDR